MTSIFTKMSVALYFSRDLIQGIVLSVPQSSLVRTISSNRWIIWNTTHGWSAFLLGRFSLVVLPTQRWFSAVGDPVFSPGIHGFPMWPNGIDVSLFVCDYVHVSLLHSRADPDYSSESLLRSLRFFGNGPSSPVAVFPVILMNCIAGPGMDIAYF